MRAIRVWVYGVLAFLLAACGAFGQVPQPVSPAGGTLGAAGVFPLLNSGTIVAPDSNYTMTYPNTSGVVISATGTLTAPRTWTLPSVAMTFNLTNNTAGGFQLNISPSAGLSIPNGQSKWIWFNGTNYVEIDAASAGAVLSVTGAGTVTCTPTTGNVVCTGAGGTGVPTNLRTLLVPTAGLENWGDSTVACWLASTPQKCFGAQLMNDMPGRWVANHGQPGYTCPAIGVVLWGAFSPTQPGQLNPLETLECGINDANSPGATTGGLNNAQLSMQAAALHLGIPFAQQVMSSNATSSTGSWSGTSFTGLAAAVQGTFEQSSTNGSTRTYTLATGAGTQSVAYFWGAANASAGTFTVSVDGTLQTNLCTSSTTFDSFGCNTQTLPGPTNEAIFGQAFTVNSSLTSHTVVVTVTSATSGSNVVYDGGVAYIQAGMAALAQTGSVPVVAVQGVLTQQGDANSTATAAYNTVMAAVYANGYAAGMTNSFFADVRNGVTAGTGYPAARGINTSTDHVGVNGTCPGGDNLHLNDCGYTALANIYESGSAAAGYPLFVKNSGSGSPTTLPGSIDYMAVTPDGLYHDFTINKNGQGYFSTSQPLIGWCFFECSATIRGAGMGFEHNPYINVDGGASGGFVMGGAGFSATCIGAQFNINTDASTCPFMAHDMGMGNFAFATMHLGVGKPSGSPSYLVAPVGVGIGISIDSQSTQGGAIAPGNSGGQATIIYMNSTTTSVYLKQCASSSGIYGTNWLTWYNLDSTTPLSTLTFSNSQIPGSTDTINGASSVTYTNIPPHTVFQVQCSQGTATTGTITLTELLPVPTASPASTTATATPATNVTSATCATATCTNLRGTYTVVTASGYVGGGANLFSLAWTATPTAYVCTANLQGGGGNVSHTVATTTGMTISATSFEGATTVLVDYFCVP